MGCDRRVEPYVPGEEPEQPDLSRIFPEGSGQQAQPMLPPSPGGGRGAAPVAAAGASVEGTISLAPELEARVPDGAVLFLIARRGAAEPPLAVKRIQAPSFPLAFSIGPEDRMIESMPFAGPLTLSARVDADANATTRSSGDLQGVAEGSYEPGARGVSLRIDEVL